MIAVSVVSLCLISALCFAGLFTKAYQDNLCQFFGLWGTACWGLARAWQLVTEGGLTSQQVVAHASIALYAAGTAYKVWKRHRLTVSSPRETLYFPAAPSR